MQMRPTIAAARRLIIRIVVLIAIVLMWRRWRKHRDRAEPEVQLAVVGRDGERARLALSVHNPDQVSLRITRIIVLTPRKARLAPETEGALPFVVPPDAARDGAPAVLEVLVITGTAGLAPGTVLISYSWEDRPDAETSFAVRAREGQPPASAP